MEPLLDMLARHMDTTPLNHVRSGRFSCLWLLPLAFLPGLFLIASLKYLDASGWMERYDAFVAFGLLTALSSLAIAFYVIRSSSLPGLRRVVATILLSVVLYFSANLLTIVLMLAIFGLAICKR